MLKSLQRRKSDLTIPKVQLDLLRETLTDGDLPTFKSKLNDEKLLPQPVEIFQMNLGYMCNQVCAHCHVDAGPDR